MAHKHSVYDTDAHFSINPFTRAIKNESTSKVAVIQHDHNSERFTFEIPRRVDGHDMSVCDRVEVHYINMDSTNPENISADIYEVDDLQVSPDDSGFVVCSWLLSENATKYAGSLNFLVRFVCLDGEKIAYAWHTAIFTGISVSSGILNNAEEIIEPYVDVLAQWKADLFGVGDTEEQRLLTVSAEQQAAISAEGQKQLEAVAGKGAAVLDSIPDEYEALQARADENTRFKAGAIVLDAEGESIVVNDASEYPLMGLKVFGKSEQIKTTGKNLLNNTAVTGSVYGVYFAVNEDKTVYVVGTATKAAYLTLDGGYASEKIPIPDWLVPGETYTINDANIFFYTESGEQTSFTNMAFVMPDGYDYYGIFIRASVGVATDKIFYPMLNIGNTVLPYEPYSGGVSSPSPEWSQNISNREDVCIDIHSKNMMNWDQVLESLTSNSAEMNMVVSDGVVSLSGTPSGSYLQANDKLTEIPKSWRGRKMYFRATLSGTEPYVVMYIKDSANTTITAATLTSTGVREFTMPPNAEYTLFAFCLNKTTVDSACTAVYSDLYLEIEDGAFEPCTEGQTITIPRTLPGIPVTSGGNYTDENGQQWICDEVDFERGVYVQRIKRHIINEDDNGAWTEYNNNETQGLSFVFWIDDCAVGFNTSLCNKFRNQSGSWGAPYIGQTGIYSDHDTAHGKFFRPPNSTITTLEQWKAWLAENEVELVYVLETPVETALSDAEITAFRALHSNKPNTTILNDAGAHMAASYVADTKTYIDRQIAALLSNET